VLTAAECYERMLRLDTPAERQRILNQFIDDFRRAEAAERSESVATPIASSDALAALVAATVESLCVELGCRPPGWLQGITSPEPYFAFGARSFALRVRLMMDSPPAFKLRRVFVPSNFLDRA
jgi:hypothetical protein